MSGDSDFDRELKEILEAGGDEPTLNEGGAPTQPTGEGKIKAGGREFKNMEEFTKAYAALEKDYTRKSQLSADAKKSMQFFKQLDEHPDLKAEIHKKIVDYNSGHPHKGTGPRAKDDVLAREVAALKSQMEGLALQREEAELRSKYNLNDEQVMDVLQKAEELGGGVPLEMVHRSLAYDTQKAAAQTEAERKAAEAAKAKAGAQTVQTNTGAVAPDAKSVKEMSQDEVDAGILAEWENKGII